MFRSADNGANWRAANNGLTSEVIHSLGVAGTNIFAGTSHGVFYSAMAVNWIAARNGPTGCIVQSFGVWCKSLRWD